MGISRGQKAGIGISGGLGGAATGAAIGSVFPGIGTLIGAGLGGLIGSAGSALAAPKTDNQLRKEALKRQQAVVGGTGQQQGSFLGGTGQQQGSFWGGTPSGVETFNQYTPEQQAAFNQVLQQALGGLGKNKFDFAPIESQARAGFAEQTIPGIAERFSRMGAQKSSAFGQELGAAGAGLEGQLAGMKQGYNLQQQRALQGLLGIGLSPQFESLYRPGSEGFGRSLASSLLTGENLFGAGKLGLGALRDWRNRPSSAANQAFSGADQAYASQQVGQQQQQPFQYAQSPTTIGGSMEGIYNPGNIVQGMQAPTAPFVPPVGAGGFMTNMGALKGLYGLQ